MRVLPTTSQILQLTQVEVLKLENVYVYDYRKRYKQVNELKSKAKVSHHFKVDPVLKT